MSSKEIYRLTIIKTPSELSLNYPILFLCLEYTVLNDGKLYASTNSYDAASIPCELVLTTVCRHFS